MMNNLESHNLRSVLIIPSLARILSLFPLEVAGCVPVPKGGMLSDLCKGNWLVLIDPAVKACAATQRSYKVKMQHPAWRSCSRPEGRLHVGEESLASTPAPLLAEGV